MNPSYKYKAIVKRVIDGDTVIFDIDKGFRSWQKDEPIRFAGLNTPEIRGIERPDGLVSKAFVEDILPVGTEVLLQTSKNRPGKYGRWIAVVFVKRFRESKGGEILEWINLNETLIAAGLAEAREY